MTEPLLEANDLTIQYETQGEAITAVSDATFTIDEGEYFGLAGESGCGKSTIAQAVIGGLDDNGEITSGELWYKSHPLHEYSEQKLNEEIRWKEISLIPQSAMNSLDPLIRIKDQAAKLADIHTDMDEEEAVDRLVEMFDIVGLQESRVGDYPHQFSGGMQQRAIIAMALFLDPSFIIADEPTTALDVIMQDQVFKYLDKIREESNTSMMLITHDISVVFESCDRIAIMHSGQVAETGSVEDVFDNPRHPYALLLQQAFPDHRRPDQELEVIEGAPPQTTGEVDFCTFVDRCPWAVEECKKSTPPLEQVGNEDSSHAVSCFRKDEVLELYRAEEKSAPDQGGSR